MPVSEQQLVEQGAALVAARRRLWDLERQLGLRSWDTFLRNEVKLARRDYTELLKERKALVSQAQMRLPDAL